MTKTEFVILVDEVFNEFDCKLLRMEFSVYGICKVNFTDGFDTDLHFYVAYRFMNRAKLRFIIMDQLDLLEPVDTELDLGF